jgi:hypothetical protein
MIAHAKGRGTLQGNRRAPGPEGMVAEGQDPVGAGAGPEGKGNYRQELAPATTLPGGDESAMNRAAVGTNFRELPFSDVGE